MSGRPPIDLRNRRLRTICSYCFRVRDEHGEWKNMERPGTDSVVLSHGICPDCLMRHYPALASRINKGRQTRPGGM